MTLGRRLLNIARAEIKSAAKKVRSSAEEVFGAANESDPVEEGAREQQEPPKRDRKQGGGRRKTETESIEVRVRRYYANLELPIGASAAEVKASYRRLMRRYHPDLHHEDPEKQAVATKLTQELRVAYEELLEYLERR